MKRMIAFLLVLLTVCSLTVACTDTPDETDPNESLSSSTGSAQPTETPVDPDKVTAKLDNMALYEIKANDGTALTWNHTYIQEAKDWEGTVWSVDYHEFENGEAVSVIYAGDFYKQALAADKLIPNKAVIISDVSGLVPDAKQGWYLRDNGDNSYKIVSAGNPKFSLQCTDGEFSVVLNENCTSTFTFTKVENQSTQYRQWISQNQRVFLRLPTDVVERLANSAAVKRAYKGSEDLEKVVEERMQQFADDVEKISYAYDELTGFTPYKRLIVHAFNHQDVMAGVVGGDCNIYINFDWYIENGSGGGDLEKMMIRSFEGKRDFNFCVLHEMGHMYDWNRGWNFESEMQADLKATYVLFKYKDDEGGAWAAPAEYSAAQIFNYDTIEDAYKGLSGNMSYKVDGDEIIYNYNIYRAAQRYTEFVKKHEAENGDGYEALKKTFHWFQDEGLTTSSMTSKERFEKFNQLLEENTKGSLTVEQAFENKTNKDKDWQAMVARGEGLVESQNGK